MGADLLLGCLILYATFSDIIKLQSIVLDNCEQVELK